jgi:hypothetical protein
MKHCKHSKWLINIEKALCGLIWTSMDIITYWNVRITYALLRTQSMKLDNARETNGAIT